MQILAGKSNQASAYLIAATLWLGFAALAGLLVMQAGSGAALNLPAVIGLLTLFVAATVAAFSLRYMRADLQSRRFYLGLGALVSSVLGWLFTGHLLVFAALWCVSGQLLAGLIGHHHDWPEANLAARRTRWTFIVGDGALVAALGLLGWQAGSWQLDVILASAAALSPLVVNLAALLMVAAAAARCALPPFSNWLLSSMTAPTPVSALMHAGLVNAGGFLLIRFAPVLEAAPAARIGAIILGLCAAVYGVGIMLVRPDVKRALAGSTISQMGFMIMSCGLGAYAAALWHIVAHGLFKAWLFLGSGAAIGMKSAKPSAGLSGGFALIVAVATLGLALALFSFGNGTASLIPLLLGLATAFALLIAALGGNLPLRSKASLVLLMAVLAAFHGLGLAATGMAIGPDAARLVPDWILLILLLVFLCAWVWQQHRVSSGQGLPLPLYVHLINAGTLPATGKGDGK